MNLVSIKNKIPKLNVLFWSKITTKNEIIFNHRIVRPTKKISSMMIVNFYGVFFYRVRFQLNLRSFQIYTCRIHLCCFLWGLVCVSVWSCFPNQQINYRYMALGATFWQNQINIILNIKAFIQINLKFLKIVLLNMCSEYVLNML